jgi:hypothetical protein
MVFGLDSVVLECAMMAGCSAQGRVLPQSRG